jgi:hypothetical protein
LKKKDYWAAAWPILAIPKFPEALSAAPLSPYLDPKILDDESPWFDLDLMSLAMSE